jgi:transcriptional regulator with XRE-family HTH domain
MGNMAHLLAREISHQCRESPRMDGSKLGAKRSDVCHWLSRRWNQLGYSHRELSKLAGVGRRTLDRIAAGTCSPSHGVLLSLMAPLNYPRAVADLLHRRAFTSLDELDAFVGDLREQLESRPSPAMTGAQLKAILDGLTPAQLALPIRGERTAVPMVGLRVGADALLIVARMA